LQGQAALRVWRLHWVKLPNTPISVVKVEGPLLEPQDDLYVCEKLHYDILKLKIRLLEKKLRLLENS
jgi:hypothetical protein